MSPEQRGPQENAVNATEPTPTEIREEIDQTRGELGDTVEALAEKTDVKAQAKAKAEQAQDLVKQNPKPAAIAGALIVLFVIWRLLR